jgi:hypothetical protein
VVALAVVIGETIAADGLIAATVEVTAVEEENNY